MQNKERERNLLVSHLVPHLLFIHFYFVDYLRDTIFLNLLRAKTASLRINNYDNSNILNLNWSLDHNM